MTMLLGLLLLAAPTTPALASLARPATLIGGSRTLALMDDYPSSALRNEEQGVVVAQWTIGADGIVRDCRITLSSGYSSLDHATCQSILKRARYTPAIDKDGKPIASINAARFVWAIP